jgi:hypothetical protein
MTLLGSRVVVFVTSRGSDERKVLIQRCKIA